MAQVRFATTILSTILLVSSNVFTGYITSQVFQFQENEMYFPIKREHGIFNWSETTNESSEHPSPPPRVQTIYMITSTEPRSTQKLDLTSLCQTLMHVSNLVWIVVEASSTKGRGVAKVLERCQVPSVHLSVPEGSGAIQQGNAGLKFLVEALCDMQRCDGVVCFGLDSTKYDLRLFKEIRMTRGVSVFTVAFSRGMLVEGPTCKNGQVATWMFDNSSQPSRQFPLSTLGFAVHTDLLLQHPTLQFGMTKEGSWVEDEVVGSAFLERLELSQELLECRSSDKEVFVWNTKSEEPDLSREKYQNTGPGILY